MAVVFAGQICRVRDLEQGGKLGGFRGGQRPPRVRPRPPRRGNQLIEHRTRGLLALTPIVGSVRLCDLLALLIENMSPILQARGSTHTISSFFASMYETSHAPHFRDTIDESRRGLARGRNSTNIRHSLIYDHICGNI